MGVAFMVSRGFGYLLAAAGLLALAGCGGASAVPQSNTMSNMMMTRTSGQAGAVLGLSSDEVQPDSAEGVGIRLNGESSYSSKHYGIVLGYFRGSKSTTSQVVQLTASTKVIFTNHDASFPHTASFLGDATKDNAPFPPSFDGGSTQSPAGTPINTTMFSTGPLNPGQSSLKYNTGPPGFYMFGCAFHYDSHGMRTVYIVQ
jgi:plastocyanin